jgi:hypothetical protein
VECRWFYTLDITLYPSQGEGLIVLVQIEQIGRITPFFDLCQAIIVAAVGGLSDRFIRPGFSVVQD